MRTISVGILMLVTGASADVIMDQIGPLDGSALGDAAPANQYFETAFAAYDIATLDNFSLTLPTTVGIIDVVIDGWNGFVDPTSITAYQANIYSSPEAAGLSLVGDEGTQEIDVADVVLSSDWMGNGFLMSAPTDMALEAGDHWVSLIPSNEFTTAGQTGLVETNGGDGINSVQANPGEGFGFGPWQELTHESAFRLFDDQLIDPCTTPLPTLCPEDITQDGYVDTADLLLIISSWGECGDGTYRPDGDIAPLPNGDCCVDLADILGVIAAWGSDCVIHGACCFGDGVCDESSSLNDCLVSGGVYYGNGASCMDGVCISAACCFNMSTCQDLTEDACSTAGGEFKGVGTACATTDCTEIVQGDECVTAIEAFEGGNPFTTIGMTPSLPVPDDTMCSATNLEWVNSPDIWFVFNAPSTNEYDFSLCDPNSFDTSMVLYEELCTNQVACNGDSIEEGTCQQYYSKLAYPLTEGVSYFIRIGGWYGATGSGTLSITLVPPPIPGACCFANEKCLDEMIEDDCLAFSGIFMGEKTTCTINPCVVKGGDECSNATDAFVGANGFNTTFATPSFPTPDETMCADSYLEWGNSPDIWMQWIATDSGVATFTTCDTNSFDTSMVLYLDSCDNQIACNGDGSGSSGCQLYYSSIEMDVAVGQTYIIRVGGWQEAVGEGTVHISLLGDNDLGACCIDGMCVEEDTLSQCDALGGQWYASASCASDPCKEPNCTFALFNQDVHGPEEDWYAGTSANDPSSNIMFERAEYVNLDSMSTVRVWGLQLYFNGSQWNDCETDYDFHVRAYSDSAGMPDILAVEVLDQPASKTHTGQLYAGIYEMMQWDMQFSAINVEHLSVSSASDGLDCWFLWLSSGEGDSASSKFDGQSWSVQEYDLSICIE